MNDVTSAFLFAALAAAATLAWTPLVRRIAVRHGVLDTPGGRKLHVRPVPYLGGVAVVGGIVLAVLAAWALPGVGPMPRGFEVWVLPVLAGMVALAGVGLLDDVRGLSPASRLIGEIVIIAGTLAWTGAPAALRLGGLEIEGLPVLPGYLLAGFWVLTLTNAGNLLDGMDGLASGVGAIAAGVLAYLAVGVFDRPAVALVMVAGCGAYAGFLVFNRYPARIYLGDAGSLALGFMLGMGSLFATTDGAGAWNLAPALLVLGVLATDLLLAVLRRGLSSVRIEHQSGPGERFVFRVLHRPRFFEADRGHLHHRLHERTGSVPRTVRILYLAALVLGLLGVWAARVPASAPMLLVGSVLLGLMTVSRVLHPELRVFEKGFLLPLFHTREVGNRRLHFVYDALVFAMAFVAAGWIGNRWVPATAPDLARVALAALAGPTAMALVGFYRIHFRRAGVWSVWKSASTIGAAAAVVLLIDTLVVRAPLASVSGVLFFYLALTGALLPRAGYVFLDEVYERRPHRGRSTLIYGTGKAEVALMHRLLARDDFGLRPIGFVDERPEIDGKMIHGLPAYRTSSTEIPGLIRSLGVEVVASAGDPADAVPFWVAARAAGVRLVRYHESLEELSAPNVGRKGERRGSGGGLDGDRAGDRRSEAG